MEEIYFVRGLYIFVLLIELGFSYWPFVGYTTRPHGLLMAGLGHCISEGVRYEIVNCKIKSHTLEKRHNSS